MPMSKRGRWVKREEEAAEYLGGHRITKKFRGNSCPDIGIPGHENLRVDLKNASRFRHHTLFREIEANYVHRADDEAVLVTWLWDDPVEEMLVVISARLFKELLRQDVQLPMRADSNP